MSSAGDGPLPSLSGGATVDPSMTGAAAATAGDPSMTGATALDPTTAAAGGQAPAAGQAAAAFDPTSLLSSARWMGPLSAIGGGFAALKGVQGGNNLLKFGGIAAALGGLALTGMGFKANGIQTGKKLGDEQTLMAIQTLEQQFQATMSSLVNEATTEITSLQQQLAQAQGGAAAGANTGVASGTAGTANGEGIGVGPGLETTVVPGNTATGTPAATGTEPAAATGINAVIGTSVQIAAGTSPGGATIADAGTFKLEQVAGDVNGYATLDEANAAARQSMSTQLQGSKFLRWMVVEQGGRYFGVIAKQLSDGTQGNPLPAQLGNVVAWSALNHVSDGGVDGWKAYSWSQAGGAQVLDVPYGATSVFDAAATGGGGGGGDRIDAAIASAVGGGPSSAIFDPASQVGLSFSVNASTTAEGDLVRGGALQVQRFVESSTGGFGTAEEAAVAARAARTAAGGGSQWSRWLTLQGGDGRFYVYEGSIVSKATSELQAAPVHVFGAGVAEYFDAATSSWKAVRDQQAVA